MNLRRLSARVLQRWETGTEGTGLHVEDHFAAAADPAGLSTSDRAFCQALVFGVVRNLTLLDALVDDLLDRRRKRLQAEVRQLLRVGLCELLILEASPHAAVNEAVAAAPKPLRGLVNAVLRRAGRERDTLRLLAEEAPDDMRFSHPQFLVSRWRARFGDEDARALMAWDNLPPPVFLRPNRLLDGAAETLAESPQTEPAPPPAGLPDDLLQRFASLRMVRALTPEPAWLERGLAYAQDPSTVFAPLLLDPAPQARVLDACAAPGGKSLLLAELAGPEGEVVAADASPDRLARLHENIRRLGAKNITTLTHDWTAGPAPESLGQLPFILADVPCSNTGVLRRRADARWRLKPESFAQMAALQSQILTALVPHLAPNGRLAYSTCSLEPEENRSVIGHLVSAHPELELTRELTLTPHSHRTDGAYVAVLTRRP